jgi:hypothetical protein
MFKPLALRIQTLADEVAGLKTLVELQAKELADLQSQDIQTTVLRYAEANGTPDQSMPQSLTEMQSWIRLFGIIVMAVTTIGLCHWILLFVYDTSPLFLRIMTITLPAGAGYLCARRSNLSWPLHLLSAMLVSTSSVAFMLIITAQIDGVPFWPSNPREWRETVEYTAAIFLAYTTGYLIYRLITSWKNEQHNKVSLRVLLARDANGKLKITEISNQVQRLIMASSPFASAGMALYSGLKAFSNI